MAVSSRQILYLYLLPRASRRQRMHWREERRADIARARKLAPRIAVEPPQRLCVPKTSSVLNARPNRLNISGDDRAALLLPDLVRLAVQVKEPT